MAPEPNEQQVQGRQNAPDGDDRAADDVGVPTRADFEREWLGRAGLTYTRGGDGDRRHPTPVTYEDCTVREVLWPGSIVSNHEGSWVAFRFRLRSGDGRQVTTPAMASTIPVGGPRG